MTNIAPLGGLVLVKKQEVLDKKLASGLIVTAMAQESDLLRGTLVAVGPGDRDGKGQIHEIPLKVGAVIFYKERDATEVTDSMGEKYEFVNWRNLFGEEI